MEERGGGGGRDELMRVHQNTPPLPQPYLRGNALSREMCSHCCTRCMRLSVSVGACGEWQVRGKCQIKACREGKEKRPS